MTTTNTRIDYKYVHLNFDWNWIKDKQIILRGNQWAGMIVVLDDKGRAVGMYGYEAIDENE
jgi:hypothetical protein